MYSFICICHNPVCYGMIATFVFYEITATNCLKSHGINHTDPVDKTNILNNQFQSVFTKLVPLKFRHVVELILPRK